MADLSVSNSGAVYLKQLLYIRDYADYDTFLKEGDRKKGVPAPLTPETAQSINDPARGWKFTLRGLVEKFNQNPEDAKKAAELFQIKLDQNKPYLKAFHFSETALTDLGSTADLAAALILLAASSLSPQGKALLKQILYIRDYIDYDTFLREGDKQRNTPAPLTPETVRGIADPAIGWKFSLRSLVEKFNQNPADVKKAAQLFHIPVDQNKPYLKAFQFSEAAEGLNDPGSHDDVRAAFCQFDKAACPPSPPTPVKPAELKPVIPTPAPVVPTNPVSIPTPIESKPAPVNVPAPAPASAPKPEPAKPVEPKSAVTSPSNKKLIGQARNLAFNGQFDAAAKARKKIDVSAGLSAEDAKTMEQFDNGQAWLAAAREQAEKGDLSGAKNSYGYARQFLPEAGPLIDKKLSLLEKRPASASAAPKSAGSNSTTMAFEPLPDDPERLASTIVRDLNEKFKQNKDNVYVRNFSATKVGIIITAALEDNGTVVAFKATVSVSFLDSDINKVIRPFIKKYSLPAGFSPANLDQYLALARQAAASKPIIRTSSE